MSHTPKHETNILTTFEQKFWIFTLPENRVSSSNNKVVEPKDHDDAGILVKSIAYLIDLWVSIFIIPILYNIYHYFKRWQTLGQQIMWIRIYRYRHVDKIATISQLLIRFMVKLVFVATWAVIGVNLIILTLSDWPSNAYSILYTMIMIIWIHGYVITMRANKHRRGIQDLWADTIVSYDHGYHIKRIIVGTIACVVLYYTIFWLGPDIVSWVGSHMHGPWEQYYRAVRDWIDMKVMSWLTTIDL